MVAPPLTLRTYNPSHYRMRRTCITHNSTDAWTLWLLQLGPDELLWYVTWYQMGGILPSSAEHNHVYLLGFTHSTWYSAVRVQRQMGVDQTLPNLDGVHFDARLTSGVIRVVLNAWVRNNRLVHPIRDPTSVQISPEYLHWLKTVVWPIERPRRVALLRQAEGWDKGEEKVQAEKEKAPDVVLVAVEVEVASPERECAPRRKRTT